MTRKKYYPLIPPKGTKYRKPRNVLAIYINSDINGLFVDAAYTYGDEYGFFEDPTETTKFVGSLPDNCWIVTYNIDNWSSLFNSMLNQFPVIRGVGRNAHVTELEDDDLGWSVIDAFQYFGCSLPDAVYKILGIETDYKTTSSVEWAAYIWLVWREVVRVLETFNIYPSKTPGATALKFWRRYQPVKVFPAGKRVQRLGRAAIRGGALHWKPGIYEDAGLYDLVASYPAIMKAVRFPMRQEGFSNRPPPTNRWIATVKINYKCSGEFSPLSIHLPDGSKINPTEVKDHRTTITYIDAIIFEQTGEFEILQWVEGVYWSPSDEVDLFSKWSDDIEEASRDPVSKVILKIVSRALHSKFAQLPYYEEVSIERLTMRELDKHLKVPGRVQQVYPLENGELAGKLLTRKRADFRAYNRPDWEALILAAGRYKIYSAIDQNTIYVHTDCIISKVPREDLSIGPGFGQWKLKDHGPAFIAGLGVYVIGEEVGKSGMKVSSDKARGAIEEAAGGKVKILQTLCHPSLFSPVSAGPSHFTVQTLNYPKAVVKGQRAWVTRSPTRLHYLKPVRRFITKGGHKRWLKHPPRR
jgi:hypothetical protein